MVIKKEFQLCWAYPKRSPISAKFGLFPFLIKESLLLSEWEQISKD